MQPASAPQLPHASVHQRVACAPLPPRLLPHTPASVASHTCAALGLADSRQGDAAGRSIPMPSSRWCAAGGSQVIAPVASGMQQEDRAKRPSV